MVFPFLWFARDEYIRVKVLFLILNSQGAPYLKDHSKLQDEDGIKTSLSTGPMKPSATRVGLICAGN